MGQPVLSPVEEKLDRLLESNARIERRLEAIQASLDGLQAGGAGLQAARSTLWPTSKR